MNNLDNKQFTKFVESISQQLENQELILKKTNNVLKANYFKNIDESKIKDERIKILLKEKSEATGEYAKRVDTLLETYIKEQKIGVRDQKRIEKLLQEQNKLAEARKKEADITKQLNRKEELANPLNAFKHAFEDYKELRKEDKAGLSSIYDATKTLGSGLKESAKQQFTVKNLTKSLLHGAGVALDLPALNILASTIESDIKARKEDNIKTQNLLDEISEVSNKPSEVINRANEFTKQESRMLDNNLSDIEVFKNLENITKDMHKELADELYDIYNENEKLNSMFKDYIYFQKDIADDMKSASSKSSSIVGKNQDTELPKAEGEKTSIFDSLSGLFGGNETSKGSKGSRFSKYGKFAKVGAGALAGLAAGIGKYFDVSNDDSLSTSQKSAQVGITSVGAGAGALAGASLGASVGSIIPGIGTIVGGLLGGAVGGFAGSELGENLGEYVSSLMGDKESTKFVNELEKTGALETSMFGSSTIKDWEAIKKLNQENLDKIIAYNDWSEEDLQKLKNIKSEKNIKPKYTEYAGLTQMAGNTDKTLNTPIVNEPIQPTVQTTQQAPIVVSQAPAQKQSARKIDSFKMEETEIKKYLMDRGIL